MNLAYHYRPGGPVAAAAGADNGTAFPGAGPVLRRVPLPRTEPPFDDELALAGAVPDGDTTGRVVNLARSRNRTLATAPGAARAPEPAPGSTSAATAPDRAAARAAVSRAAAPPVVPHVAVPDAAVVASAVPASAAAAISPPDVTPVRLRLVGAPVSRAGRRSPARATRASRPLYALHASEPAATPGQLDPGAGLGPGPRLSIDSATHRSLVLGSVDDVDLPRISQVPATPMPDPRPLAAQVIQAVVEVLAGDRRITQLTAWVDEDVYAAVAAAAPELSRSPTTQRRSPVARIRLEDRPIVRSVHVTEPASGVAEVVARVQTGHRSRAVALRLEQWRGRWRCSALAVG